MLSSAPVCGSDQRSHAGPALPRDGGGAKADAVFGSMSLIAGCGMCFIL